MGSKANLSGTNLKIFDTKNIIFSFFKSLGKINFLRTLLVYFPIPLASPHFLAKISHSQSQPRGDVIIEKKSHQAAKIWSEIIYI